MSSTTSTPRHPAAMSGRNNRSGATAASTLSVRRLNVMRIGYLVMGVGLAVTKWPLLINRT